MANTFALNTNNNPSAMPAGDSTISTHRTLAAAFTAAARERRAFARSVHSTGGAYLHRVITEYDETGSPVAIHSAWDDTDYND